MKKDIKLTPEERTACTNAFRNFDRDGKGTIDSRELKQVKLRASGLSVGHLSIVFGLKVSGSCSAACSIKT